MVSSVKNLTVWDKYIPHNDLRTTTRQSWSFLVPCEESVRTFLLLMQRSTFDGSMFQEEMYSPNCFMFSSCECPPTSAFFAGCFSFLLFTSPWAAAAYTSLTLTLGKQTSRPFYYCHKCHSVNQPLGHAHVQCNLFPPPWAPASPSSWLELEPSLGESVVLHLGFGELVSRKPLFSR